MVPVSRGRFAALSQFDGVLEVLGEEARGIGLEALELFLGVDQRVGGDCRGVYLIARPCQQFPGGVADDDDEIGVTVGRSVAAGQRTEEQDADDLGVRFAGRGGGPAQCAEHRVVVKKSDYGRR